MRLVSTLAHVVPGEVPEHEPGRVFTRLGALAASRRLAVRPHAAPGPAPSLGSVRAPLPNLILLPGLLIEFGAQAPDFPIDRSDLPAQSLNVGARREIEQVHFALITNPALHAATRAVVLAN